VLMAPVYLFERAHADAHVRGALLRRHVNAAVEDALVAFCGTRGPAPSDEALWATFAWRFGYGMLRDFVEQGKSEMRQHKGGVEPLDEHVAKFEDPGKIATFSDGGNGAESIRNGGVDTPSDVIEAALSQLSERDKAFARAVLDGKRWPEMRMPKATFYRRLKKVGAEVRLPPSKSSL